MKRIKTLLLLAVLLMGGVAFAQTPEEILTRMEKAMEASETEGLSMVVDMKVPIIGTTPTTIQMLGEKSRMETKLLGKRLIMWTDGQTDWEYDERNNAIEISKNTLPGSSEAQENAEMFEGISDGYDLSIQKETPEAWYIRCKKSKDNPEEDVPKSMDLVVAKGTYFPVSLKTKVSGVTVYIHDMRLGVSEKDVTFRLEDFPGAKVVDKR